MHTVSKATIAPLFNGLGGSWRLQRELGQAGTMEGIAHFRAWAPGVWHYEEQGRADWGGSQRTSVYRAYAYLYDAKAGTMAVHFWQDPQGPAGLLHVLQFRKRLSDSDVLVAAGRHQCGEDTYKACYRFFTADRFQLTYGVQGPRKDYVLQTQFERMTNG